MVHLPQLTGYRHNKRHVDLSLTCRLSGLPPGAQLELVQASRSPAVVNIAIQLPPSENSVRLTDKFPSSTSLWQVLRRFESGAAGGTQSLNLTQRGIASTDAGAGRLFYEMPTLSVMSRELSSFQDLQKTLTQIGVTSGSALMRLNFRNSGKPLEEAMREISEYFQQAEDVPLKPEDQHAKSTGPPKVEESIQEDKLAGASDGSRSDPSKGIANDIPTEPSVATGPTCSPSNIDKTPNTPPSQEKDASRSIAVFAAPATAPVAASIPYNDADYVPTVDHAKSHQARLEASGKNTRLLSDKELEEQRQERATRLKTVNSIRVRFRMPDQTQIQTSYGREDTTQSLLSTLRDVVRSSEPLVLSYRDASGKQRTVDPGVSRRLIEDLGWMGDTLITISWGTGASEIAKQQPVLKDEYLATATHLKVEVMKEADDGKGVQGFLGGLFGKDKGKEKSSKTSSEDKEAKMRKLLGFGRK